MKKIYNAPELSVVKIQTQGFLALSANGNNLTGTVSNTDATSGFADGRGSDDEW